MNIPLRILLNTTVLYAKIVISLVINLILTRVVLAALGIEDFGIYNLIAGIIAVLAFVQAALMSSSQRFLSVALGEGNDEKTSRYFSAGVMIHIGFGLLVVALFEVCGLFLFDGFLNIPEERIGVAEIIYQVMIVSTLITMLGVPFHATINAYEDIWFYGIVQILCMILRLGLIFGFSYFSTDKLVLYSLWMAATIIIGSLASMIWCFCKYDTCKRITLSYNTLKKDIKTMMGFAGWNTLGAFAIATRNQGVSIVLNLFFGPKINGVFGLANQVDGHLSGFASTLTASLSPQIVKSYGQRDIPRLQRLSLFACKLSFLLSAIFAIPLLIELPLVLKVWLVEVPPYAETYIKLVLIIFLILELYPGLNRGIQAVGEIKWQQIQCSICVVLPIPIGIAMFALECPHYAIIYVMILMQAASLAIHVFWAHRLYNLSYKLVIHFIGTSILLFAVVYSIGFICDYMLMTLVSNFTRFTIVVLLTIVAFGLSYFHWCLNDGERHSTMALLRKILHVENKK